MKTYVDSDPDWVMMKSCLQQLAGCVPVTTGSFRHHSHLWFSLMWHTVTFSDTPSHFLTPLLDWVYTDHVCNSYIWLYGVLSFFKVITDLQLRWGDMKRPALWPRKSIWITDTSQAFLIHGLNPSSHSQEHVVPDSIVGAVLIQLVTCWRMISTF